MIKNVGKSIRTRLLTIAREEKQDYMKVLGRYFHERLLYRISQSDFKNHFLLKGSALLYAHYMFKARPTIDIDLLGESISRDEENIKSSFREILSVECPEDGVRFDTSTIQSSPIAIEKKYPGICLSVKAYMDTIELQVSIDIGFGDVVTPHPVPIDYPILIKTVPPVEVMSYSLETLVAEKFQAMIDRDVDNSRMKDFYDLYKLFQTDDIERNILGEAIRNTFTNRGTRYAEGKHLFDVSFAEDESRCRQWNGFLRKLKIAEGPSFEEVMAVIREQLQPFWNPGLIN